VQLVSYPVEGDSNMNKKFLFRDKALTYAKQGRLSAETYKKSSNEAYQNIESLTEKYNQLSNGKWQGMMDMKPRRLPVFDKPEIQLSEIKLEESLGLSVEDTLKTSNGDFRLPTFYVGDSTSYFIDIFLKNPNTINWQIKELPNWMKATKVSGVLEASKLLENRIHISIDWNLWKNADEPTSTELKSEANSEEKTIQINISKSYNKIPKNAFIEKNNVAVIYANHFSKNEEKPNLKWEELIGFGHSKSVMQAEHLNSNPVLNIENAPVLEYSIYTETITEIANLTLAAIPTHPLTTDGDLRIAVQWNDEPIQSINFKTEGRSNDWKQNVLSNKAIKKIQVPIKNTGKQTLKIYMMDVGVLLDYIVLNTSEASRLPYKLMPETKIND